jgi:hypothetical protein
MKPKGCFPVFLVLERHIEIGGGPMPAYPQIW